MATTLETTNLGQPAVPREKALQIARGDAEKVYRNLSEYRIEIRLEQDGWHVDYELKDPDLDGGGPHYVINASNGQIVSKRYEQ